MKSLVTTLRMIVLLLLPCFSLAQNKVSHDVKSDTTEFTKGYSDKFKSNFLIGTGLHINTISPSSTSNYYGAGGRTYTSYLPEVSFGMDVFTNPNTQKLVFRLEAALAQSQYKYSYMNQVYPYVGFKTSFDEVAFTIMPQVIFNFYNTENLKIFGGLGAAISFFKYTNSSYGPQQPNAAYQGTADNPYFFNNFDSGLVVKAGIKFNKRWAVFGSYFSNVAVTQAGYFSLTSSCKQIGLNYFF
ncbi:MAG TPA: hypothetical protein VFE54_14155 [Mucilaginibacter sp.]|nr:hypothetical protein [Mucilaginibacter sp.]